MFTGKCPAVTAKHTLKMSMCVGVAGMTGLRLCIYTQLGTHDFSDRASAGICGTVDETCPRLHGDSLQASQLNCNKQEVQVY